MDGVEEDVRRGFQVTGRVQGVGFRWWTRGTASELGLRGTVRNCADGSVEAHAAGPAAAMDRFEALLQRGPTGSRVDALQQIEVRGDLPVDDFIIEG